MIVARIILNHSRIKQAVNILSFLVTMRVTGVTINIIALSYYGTGLAVSIQIGR